MTTRDEDEPSTGSAFETEPDLDEIGEALPLLEGLRTTRAIRRLRPDPVPRPLIRKVCEAGTFAPERRATVSRGSSSQSTTPSAGAGSRTAIARSSGTTSSPPSIAREAEDFPERLKRNMRASLHLAEHLHEAPRPALHRRLEAARGEEQFQALYPCAQNVLLACRGGRPRRLLHDPAPRVRCRVRRDAGPSGEDP